MPGSSGLGLVLWSTDIPALSQFLEKAGGAVIEERHPGYAALLIGDSRVILHADEAFRGHPWFDALRREGVARGIGAEIRLTVPDVEAAYQAALRLGGLAIEAPCEVDGMEECQVMGPDGFIIGFWRPLGR